MLFEMEIERHLDLEPFFHKAAILGHEFPAPYIFATYLKIATDQNEQ